MASLISHLETLLNSLIYLGEKFPIETIQFQDPAFTKGDQEFLEKRGYTVIKWDDSLAPKAQYSIDPRLSEFLSPSTMCYCPYLDLPSPFS